MTIFGAHGVGHVGTNGNENSRKAISPICCARSASDHARFGLRAIHRDRRAAIAEAISKPHGAISAEQRNRRASASTCALFRDDTTEPESQYFAELKTMVAEGGRFTNDALAELRAKRDGE